MVHFKFEFTSFSRLNFIKFSCSIIIMNFLGKSISKLFLAYFLIYVLSPFCFADNQLNVNTAITSNTEHNTSSIHVIWELVFSEIFQKENAEDNNVNVRAIIKKARAVLRADNSLKLAHSEFTPSIQNDVVPLLEPLSTLMQFLTLNPQKGFCISFSGPSPPSV